MSYLKKAKRTLHTVRYLKPKQVLYRLKYAISTIDKLRKFRFDGETNSNFKLPPLPHVEKQLSVENDIYTFHLLNLEKSYPSSVEWNDTDYGRLWNYNLRYAGFLHQNDLPVPVREKLVLNLYDHLFAGKLPPEPYTASLRSMNLIRFFSEHSGSIQKPDLVLSGLFSELQFLSKRLEYHILGNHLLENAFALLMGGVFLNQENWFKAGKDLLRDELNEQILDDGAHFERSPMYHQIILFRVLESISYLHEGSDFREFLENTASKMISWGRKMTFAEGSTAHFNDSVDGVAFSANDLIELAQTCGVDMDLDLPLSESGFRKLKSWPMELVADFEGIKPDYQPGHAHADSLSFILHINGKPVIADPAVSTYEPGERRDRERSTKAHNTITVNNENSADVWSVFRVGRRPEIEILDESENTVAAKLNYVTESGIKVEHQRRFTTGIHSVEITDRIKSKEPATGRLHFAPSVEIEKISGHTINLTGNITIKISDSERVSTFRYLFNTGFNKQAEANGIEYQFRNYCAVQIIAG